MKNKEASKNQVVPRVPAERPGKKGGKRDENRKRQVASICEAALPLFCEQGLMVVTIDEIVKAAGIAKGSFYRYFKDKEELVATLFAPLSTQLSEAIAGAEKEMHAAERPEELTAVYGKLAATVAVAIAGKTQVLQLYLQESRSPAIGARKPIVALREEIERAAFELTKVAREHGLLRSDYDHGLGTLVSLGAIERVLLAYLSGDALTRGPEVPAQIVSIIVDGVRAG